MPLETEIITLQSHVIYLLNGLVDYVLTITHRTSGKFNTIEFH